MVWNCDFDVRKKVCILLLNTTPFFLGLFWIQKWFKMVWNCDLYVTKKGVYPITKYHTFFPRPIFDTKLIWNDLKWSDIVIFMLEKKVCILLLNTTPFFLDLFLIQKWLKMIYKGLKLWFWCLKKKVCILLLNTTPFS